MQILRTFNIRTGEHYHKEGEIWREHDGPQFLGYFKAVKGDDGKLARVQVSEAEYAAYLAQRRSQTTEK